MMRPRQCPAVLLLVYNRPHLTSQVLKAIRQARPKRLYVAADGPGDAPGEEDLCSETRKIATEVDWECAVKTLFRTSNIGCKEACSSALDWFFHQEEDGIILEDDCLPSSSFFRYCAELLERYRDEERIMCISGNNFQQGRSATPDSYYFSRYPHCWGWASWRRAWNLYDSAMVGWPAFRDSDRLGRWSDGRKEFEEYWRNILDKSAAGEINSWAYRWTFSCWANDGLTCLPEKNLVCNLGFGGKATHTTDTNSWQANLPMEELGFPLRHPATIFRNSKADEYTDRMHFGIEPNSNMGRYPKKLTRALIDRAKSLLNI